MMWLVEPDLVAARSGRVARYNGIAAVSGWDLADDA